jgi:hypothetical protein
MHIHDTLQSERFANLCVSAATTQRPIFWQPKLPRSQLRWCYAKITPAALQRGNFANRGRENGEAVGRRLEFRSRDFSRPICSAPQTTAYKPCMIRS